MVKGPWILGLGLLVAACGGGGGAADAPAGADRMAPAGGGTPAATIAAAADAGGGAGGGADAPADAPGRAPGGADGTAQGPAGTADGAPADAADDTGSAPEDRAAAATLTRLTAPGCCTLPYWSADGRRVQFIDRPAPDLPVGVWAVDAEAPGAPPTLVTDEIGYFSPDMRYRIEIAGDRTTLERIEDGARWDLPAAGRPISIAPGGQRIAWQVSPPNTEFERRTTRVWVAGIDGSGAREVAALPRGSLVTWIDAGTLLLRGRDRLDALEDVLWALGVDDGARREIARAPNLRGELPSPGGGWVAYYVARHDDPSDTGMWIAATGGGAPKRIDKALFGAYRWRDDGRLLVVPQDGDGVSHALVEVDVATLATRRLTDPATMPFKIANGDWTVSPDGRRVAFVESGDKAIWVLGLPD